MLLIGGFIYPYYRLFIFGLVLLAVFLIWLLLAKTKFGLIVRAGASDPEIVEAMGVNLKPMQSAIFGLGSFWGVLLAGVLVGVVRGVTITFFPPAAEASMYALMVLILLVRPRGLFGERMERLE
ncbi:MAG: hypothetical protein ACE5DS_01950 [Kiloniellaceae bacterium]